MKIQDCTMYWRNPTLSEIKFGEGEAHYKYFNDVISRKLSGELKKWIKCPIDGLR